MSDEIKYCYKLSRDGRSIERYRLVKFTKSRVTYIDHYRTTVAAIRSDWASWYATLEEAEAMRTAALQNAIDNAKETLTECANELALPRKKYIRVIEPLKPIEGPIEF